MTGPIYLLGAVLWGWLLIKTADWVKGGEG